MFKFNIEYPLKSSHTDMQTGILNENFLDIKKMLKCKPRVKQQQKDKHSSSYLTKHYLLSHLTYVFLEKNKRRVLIILSYNNFTNCLLILSFKKLTGELLKGENNKSFHTCK